ncbi:MAG TPA: RNA polymerase subunit sigma-70 [Aggregatilineales bacterium]|nr:RNA polymerase subunit sigma-70 [Aggregatilineales bacterium]
MSLPDEPISLPLSISDRGSFERHTIAYHRELLVHCYRILGSVHDAEDAVQESFLRAWRKLDSLREQASVRAWLYKIATNVSLDMLDRRKARLLPPSIYPAADPNETLPPPVVEPIWLEPLPDSFLDGANNDAVLNPESRYELKESLTLAFLTLLQELPGRQRVVLILRDVMGWKAQEVADLLDVSVVAVNSALQRARAKLNGQQIEKPLRALNDNTARLLTRYVSAWEAADSSSLIALLREDAILTMPPIPAWYRGRSEIKTLIESVVFAGRSAGHFRLVSTSANNAPAFVVYERTANNTFHPTAIQVLMVRDDKIARMDDFIAPDPELISRFERPVFD